MKITGEHSVQNKSTRITLAAGLLAVTAITAGCSSAHETPERATVQTVWPHMQSPTALRFDGVVEYQGSSWPINCYAKEMTSETAQEGDTLLSLAHKADTKLVDPSSVNLHRISPAVFAVALAHLNNLENPDLIQEGQTYQFPEVCTAG